jgi:hypothetical protein
LVQDKGLYENMDKLMILKINILGMQGFRDVGI